MGRNFPAGRCHVDAALPGILEDADANLSGAVRMLLAQLKVELDQTSWRCGLTRPMR
jgi:hypothetical protein